MYGVERVKFGYIVCLIDTIHLLNSKTYNSKLHSPRLILECVLSVDPPGLKLRVCTKKLFFLFFDQTYVVGTQKNRLNETVLLSTQNICSN